MSGAAGGATSGTGCMGGAHQESDVQRAGSTLLGVTVKVLSRILMTGRALGRGGGWGVSWAPRSVMDPPWCQLCAHLADPGRWQGQDPSMGGGGEGKGLQDAHGCQVPYLSRTILSAKLPTSRSG